MLPSTVHHYQRAPVARSEPASSCSERGPALGRLPFWTDPPCSASTASSARRSWTKVWKTFSFAENGSSKMEGAEQSNLLLVPTEEQTFYRNYQKMPESSVLAFYDTNQMCDFSLFSSIFQIGFVLFCHHYKMPQQCVFLLISLHKNYGFQRKSVLSIIKCESFSFPGSYNFYLLTLLMGL